MVVNRAQGAQREMEKEIKFIVILAHALCSNGNIGIDHSTDGRKFDTSAEAIKHGFTLGRSDDFNIGEVDGGKLMAVYWMDKRLDEKPEDLAEIEKDLCL